MIDSVDAPSGSAPADLRLARRKKASLADPFKVDRLPPNSIEAEQGVLGCILLSPRECIGVCVEAFKAGAEVFYDLRHRTTYEALVRMDANCQAIDLITLQQVLKDANQLEGVGGLSYLASLPDAVPSAANLEYYTVIVLEKFTLRRIIASCTALVGQAYEHQGEVKDLLEMVEADLVALSSDGQAMKLAIKAAVRQVIDEIDTAQTTQGKLQGVATGFPDLDKMTGGLRNGDMIVIAGRPSMGKTALGMQIAERAAINDKLPVGVFSMEMSTLSLVRRMLFSRAKVNGRRIEQGFINEGEFTRLQAAAIALANAPIHLDDTSRLPLAQLRSRARQMVQIHGVKLFVIDYLQLMTCPGKRNENRQQEITTISSGIKALAKELNVPIIVLAQLNRSSDKDNKKPRRPRVSDIRESGAIEQDADLIGLLHKDAPEDDDDHSEAEAVELIIGKQRNGPTGEVHLTFLKPMTRFESAAKIRREDIEVETTVRRDLE